MAAAKPFSREKYFRKKKKEKQELSFTSNEETFDDKEVVYPEQELGVRKSQCLHWFVPGAHWLGPLAAKGKEMKKVTSRIHFFFCLHIRSAILMI